MINNKALPAEGNLYTYDMTKMKAPFSAYLMCHVTYFYSVQINSLLKNISPALKGNNC